MSESEGSEPQFNREQVVDAFRKFVEKGITHPDDLPLDDQEVISANALQKEWVSQRTVEA